jgi:hypothetical protein
MARTWADANAPLNVSLSLKNNIEISGLTQK